MPYPSVLRILKTLVAASACVLVAATGCDSPEFDLTGDDSGASGGTSSTSDLTTSTTTTGSGGSAGDTSMPAHCSDGIIDGSETDEDCGGACKPCQIDEKCKVGVDCENGECTNGRCRDASCGDEVFNGDESDIDCGGEECPGCKALRACRSDSDCISNHCEIGICQEATCDDTIQNDRETGVDCGGGTCPGCDVGEGCEDGTDCAPPPNSGSESVVCSETTETCQLVCGAGTADCNQRAQDGCEVTLATDLDHCGDCDTPCDLDNADPQCLGGRCQIVACAEGFQNCNTDVEDGCEVDTSVDADNCGACNEACSNHHGSSSCDAGACVVACHEGYENCNLDLIDGCESNLLRDVLHCQSCEVSCDASSAALTAWCDGSGTGCGESECEAGLGDCDGDGECSDDLESVTDCGRCGNECHVPHGTPSCDEGQCAVAECDEGSGRAWANCDEVLANGCERELNSDRRFCGDCENDCTELLEAGLHVTDVGCARGGCLITSCETGWADCDGEFANGCEVDTTSDPAECGGCAAAGGVDCDAEYANGSGLCVDSKCEFAECDPEFGDCDVDAGAGRAGDGCETSISFNDEHCGGCGLACETSDGTTRNTCGGDGATCQPACADDFGDCNENPRDGCETELLVDRDHCGDCGQACLNTNADNECALGVCVPDCESGFQSCDGDPRDGCEQNIHTLQHCGDCDEECSSANGGTPSCPAGECAVDCSGAYQNCNDEDDERDGCETNTNTNTAHCGGCDQGCGDENVEELACSGGTCAPTCAEDWCVDDPAAGCTEAVGTAANCSECGDTCAAPTPFCADDGGFHCDALDVVVVNSTTGDEAAFNNASTVLSFDHTLEGAAGDYRLVLIAVNSYFGQPYLVSYNGLPIATPVRSSTVASDTWLGIYMVRDDELPAPGNRNVTVQFEAAAAWGWGQANVVELAGVDQNTPIHTNAASNNTINCSSSNPRTSGVTFSGLAGSFVYAVVAGSHATTGSLVAGGFTSTYLAATASPSGGEHGFMAAALSGPQTAGTTASWNVSGCYNSSSVAVGIQPAVSLAP